MPSTKKVHSSEDLLPVVFITGTPGSGKSTLASIVAKKLSYVHLNLSMIVRNSPSLIEEYDEKRECSIFSDAALARWLKKKINSPASPPAPASSISTTAALPTTTLKTPPSALKGAREKIALRKRNDIKAVQLSTKQQSRDPLALLLQHHQQHHQQQHRRHKGFVIDFHSTGFLPPSLVSRVHLAICLRCDTTVLYDRLATRKYPTSKTQENVEAEIFQVVLDEARETFKKHPHVLHERQSTTAKQMASNVTWIVQRMTSKEPSPSSDVTDAANADNETTASLSSKTTAGEVHTSESSSSSSSVS